MFNINNLFSCSPSALSKDEMAEMLKTNSAALAAFEKTYLYDILENDEPKDFFEVNSRQMADHMKSDAKIDNDFVNRIVDEFLSETKVWKYIRPLETNAPVHINKTPVSIYTLPDGFNLVTKDEIQKLPLEQRPQCTSTLQKRDIMQMSYPMLLMNYMESKNQKNDIRKRQQYYHMFRQGLDILDIDPVTYEIIGTNPVSMGYWLPQIVDAIDRQKFFKIPSTTIIKVPMNILQLTRTEYQKLTRTTLDIVDKFCYKAFDLKEDGDYFIKTGTYSSKFDFRNCRIHDPKEVKELGEYLLFIHSQACQMAGHFNVDKNGKLLSINVDKNGKPLSIYGMSTTNEWCVREYIPDVESNPCIYKGLPLHTEYRVFVDFNTNKVLSCVPYWDPDTMKKKFEDGSDSSVHDKHDYVIYKAHEETLMKRYNDNKETVVSKLSEIIPDIELSGQWSIDIMQNGNDFWIIDMATAQTSAFKESIPAELRKPLIENWLPNLSQKA